MKRLGLIIFILLILFSLTVAKEESDITDIQEKGEFKSGEYKSVSDSEGVTLNVLKGEGFDFKVPEIIITGQIDTKIMLNREIKSLENLQNIKNILYEPDRIYVPDYYLKEDKLLSLKKVITSKDFVGRLKLFVGTYNTFSGDLLIGKNFYVDNFILRGYYTKEDNDIINDRKTYKIFGGINIYYSTIYDFIKTLYNLNIESQQYLNPYPDNLLKGEFLINNIPLNINFLFEINKIFVELLLSYKYINKITEDNDFLYKENKFINNIKLIKDFIFLDTKKVKTILNIKWFLSEIHSLNYLLKNVLNIDFDLKGIFYFEPIILQGGFNSQYYKKENYYYRANPYLNISYDILPNFSYYFEFNPKMKILTGENIIKIPYSVFNKDASPSFEVISFNTGIYLNILNLFFNAFYVYKDIKNYIYMDELTNTHMFTWYNADIVYNFLGIKINTLKIKNFSLKLGYRNQNIITSTKNITYFPHNIINIDFLYEKAEWKFKIRGRFEDAKLGTNDKEILPYFILDLFISREIMKNFVITGYINNVLNNKYYLLYYYKEKPFNLGIGVKVKF